MDKPIGLRLRSPAVALLTAMAIALSPCFMPTDGNARGLLFGCIGAQYFDTASLQEAFGLPFSIQPCQTFTDGLTAAENAVSAGKVSHIVCCLDGSEATSAYHAIRPADVDDLEKIGQADLYRQDHGNAFSAESAIHRLDRRSIIISELTTLARQCKSRGIQLTVIFMPLHTSRFSTLHEQDLADYKQRLAATADFWDFSYSSLSADARYFYSKDCARSSTLDLVLDRVAGKPIPVENFGTKISRNGAAEQIKSIHSLSLSSMNHTTEVPILLYHHLTEQPKSRADITPATFRTQMEALVKAGYTAVTAADMIAYVETGTPLPEKPIWITFDDGYTSNYTYAYPILKSLGLKGTIFAIGSSIGKTTYKDTGYPITPHFDQKQLTEMTASGVIEVQSHTWDLHQHAPYETSAARTTAHPLAGESTEAYRTALALDHKTFAKKTGINVYALAYPKGQYTRDSEDIFHSLGVKLTVSTATDRKNILVKGLPQSLYALCRFDLPEGMTTAELLALIS